MNSPFEIVHKGLLTALRETTIIREYISEGNLIDFTENDSSPLKKGVASADLPELMLYLSAVSGNLHASSSHTMLTTTWRFILSSGSFQTTLNNNLAFAVIQVLTRWHTHLRPLTWADATFVKDVRLSRGDSGISNAEQNRNIRGWSTIMDFEIDFGLSLQSVKETT